METSTTFFIAMHGQSPGTSMESAHFTLSSSRRRKGPKSKPYFQHKRTDSFTCRGPICKSFCGNRQTSKPHLTSQPISLSLARRSGMASQFLLLLTLIYVHSVMSFTTSIKKSSNEICDCDKKIIFHAYHIATAPTKTAAAIHQYRRGLG